MYIRAKADDNVIGLENDPRYFDRLVGVPAHLMKAWREGDWEAAAGGYFLDVWDRARQVLPVFEVPSAWRRFRSFDWGYAAPSSLGLWAVSDGSPAEGIGVIPPPGSLVRTGEWYGVKRDSLGRSRPNEGSQLSDPEQGRSIAAASAGISWSGCVADPQIFSGSPGGRIYDNLRAGAKLDGVSLTFSPAVTKDRVAGWRKMHAMLEQSGKEHPERPGLWIVGDRCPDWLRTVPVIPSSPSRPDDVDTTAEDHCCDETRYAVISALRTAGYTSWP